ncbi:hypothetical protein BGW36DRAFT_380347 [Talaromyces proteolyticus]|uniref:RING-type domain-containing protein n=1 Tax=Talaromyces proteolyticus TaxID=1131652 RepID=A0AAD4KPG2_9EURO|nr:uncharacterized protein BGW36DRAFT_380347 [Talaromyces proteolyticus]KAH8696153.1 hypothetical protein BGW36DRAFT_380347 [Talaromyces proteolyticus]
MSRRPPSTVIDLTSGSRQALQHHLHRHNSTNHYNFDLQGPSNSRTQQDQQLPPPPPPPPPRGVKRRRFSDETIGLYTTPTPDAEDDIEAVDLTDVNNDSALAEVLSKQREDAVRAQQATEHKEGRTTLSATKCAICMDTPTDATTTICGHLFCHKCIIDSLRYDEERSEATTGKSSRGKCPACRKQISRRDAPGPKRDLIPLQFKLKRPS